MKLKILFISLLIILIAGCTTHGPLTNEVQANITNNAVITQTYSHHEIHEGHHYYLDDKVTLGNGANRDILLITPACNLTRYVHLLAEGTSNGIITSFALYENVTYSAIGTIEPIHNRNRVLNYVSLSSAYVNPTITNTGLIINDEHWGIKEKAGGIIRDTNEILLNCDTNYLIRITSGETSNLVNIKLDWYENGLEE